MRTWEIIGDITWEELEEEDLIFLFLRAEIKEFEDVFVVEEEKDLKEWEKRRFWWRNENILIFTKNETLFVGEVVFVFVVEAVYFSVFFFFPPKVYLAE